MCVVETAGNSPGPIILKLKAASILILHKCTTIRHALSAEKLGVDFLSIDGFECAGHVGETDITNFVLLRRAAQTLKTPFIASGGFADGEGLAGALALGACGINMGTRFMCTIEAPVHINIKRAIVDADENHTELLLRRWRNTSRLYKNKVALAAKKIELESTTGKFEEVAPYMSGKRGRQVFITGDIEEGVSSFPRLPCGIWILTVWHIGVDCGTGYGTHPGYSIVRGTHQKGREGGGGRDPAHEQLDRVGIQALNERIVVFVTYNTSTFIGFALQNIMLFFRSLGPRVFSCKWRRANTTNEVEKKRTFGETNYFIV